MSDTVTQSWDAIAQQRDRAVDPVGEQGGVRAGVHLMNAGYVEQGYQKILQAAQQAPDHPYAQLNCWTHLHYLPEHTREQLYQGFSSWARRFLPIPESLPVYPQSRDPHRQLRIGYLSADLRRHSVAYSVEAVLESHDRDQVFVVGYANVPHPDEMTDRMASKMDAYHNISGWDLPVILDRIQRDHIDILVLMAGNTEGNDLAILASKPAPIQVDWGSIGTSGMEQIDYRITDEVVDPPASQATYTETLVSIAGGATIFRPPSSSPLVAPLPALENGTITFGSFNNGNKLNAFTLDLFARVLHAVPGSRLMLKLPRGDDLEVQQRYGQWFDERGINIDRLIFKGRLPDYEYLRVLGQVDMGLDAYPYNGAISTLEALWMGVPVLTLSGEVHVSRVGRNLLGRLGLEMFASQEVEVLVDKAVAFSQQVAQLSQIRQGLRTRMLQSPLCDPGRYAGELERAYRRMWQQWIANHEPKTALS